MTTDPRATLRALFKEDSAYASTISTILEASLQSGQTGFKWNSRYEALGLATWERLEDAFHPSGRNYDLIFNIVDMGSQVIMGASGPSSRLVRVGIQPVAIDKQTATGWRLLGHKAVYAGRDAIDTILDTYYRVSDGNLKWPGGHTPGGMGGGLVYGPTVESLTQVYLETTSGTAEAAEKSQRFTNIYIGYSGATPGTTYRNLTGSIMSFTFGSLHPSQWQDTANAVVASDLSQGHFNWWFQLVFEGDYYAAFYTQPVTGAAGTPALVVGANSGKINYLKVIEAIRAGDGTSKTRTWTLADSGSSTYAYILEPSRPDANTFVYRGVAQKISCADA